MKKLVVVAIVAGTAYAGWRWQASRHEPDTSGPKLAFNRFWIDHLPTSERELFNVVVLSRPESIGAFAQESMWHGQMEKFRFDTDGDKIRAVFPLGSGEREQITIKATRCDEADMDFCLELTGSKHGVSRYYSRNGWERRDADDLSSIRELVRSAR